jgi:hypothetical protein
MRSPALRAASQIAAAKQASIREWKGTPHMKINPTMLPDKAVDALEQALIRGHSPSVALAAALATWEGVWTYTHADDKSQCLMLPMPKDGADV